MFAPLDRTVFNAVAEPLLVVSPAGVLAGANTAAKRMLGLPALADAGTLSDLFTRRGGDLGSYIRLCASSRTALPAALSRRQGGGETMACLGRICRTGKADEPPLVLLQLRSASDSGRRFTQLTELRRAESQRQRRGLRLRLHQSERLAAAVIRHVPDAFVRLDSVGLVQDWNPEAERLFGWSRQEVLDLPPPPILGEGEAAWTPPQGDGDGRPEVRRLRLTGRSRSGRMLPIELTLIRLPVPDGLTTCAFLRDMTELTESQAQLLRAQKTQVLGSLTGGVAHDFNNLLTVVLGSAELLSMRPDLDEKARQLVANILLSAEKGAELTRRLLAFARRQPLQPEPTELARLIREMAPLLRTTVGAIITVDVEAPSGLPLVMADPAQIESALLNLVLNARDALPNGGRVIIECNEATIDEAYATRFEELSPGEYVVLSVSDDGTGMPADVLKRATEPFFTTKDVGKGSGLGLSMIYGFAKQSGGHLNLYSEVGHGTTIRLYLPRAAGAIAAEVHRPAPQVTAGGQKKVLVVEDDVMVREQAVAVLAGLGHLVVEASSGLEAVEIAMDNPDLRLVLMDLVLPGGMSGKRCADAILQRRPDIRILYTSGYTETAIANQGRLDPGAELLSKPYRNAELAERVRRLFDSNL